MTSVLTVKPQGETRFIPKTRVTPPPCAIPWLLGEIGTCPSCGRVAILPWHECPLEHDGVPCKPLYPGSGGVQPGFGTVGCHRTQQLVFKPMGIPCRVRLTMRWLFRAEANE